MFFDMHTDILYDLVSKRLQGKRNIIKDGHLKDLLEGNIMGGIWTYYTDIEKPLCEFNRAIYYILEELYDAFDYINLVKWKRDFFDHKINVVLGFESLQPIQNIKHLEEMVDLGFRHAMLTWNEQNHFATGVAGKQNRGLTDLGKQVISYMNQKNMIIDVSHTNQKSFYEIIDQSTQPVIASHSNCFHLCNHRRNLTDDQIDQIVKKNGVIGLTAVKFFTNPENPTVAQFVNHLDYLKDKNLLDHITFGFDFMDYLHDDHTNLIDLSSAKFTHNLLTELQNRGYSDESIQKVSYINALRVIKAILN